MSEKETYFRSAEDQAAVEESGLAFQALSKQYLNRSRAGVPEILESKAEALRRTTAESHEYGTPRNTTWASPTHQ
jgi:hypothetical protein